MTFNKLKYIRAVVNATVEDCKRKNYAMRSVVFEILDILMKELFWNYETDMPTVNYDLWDMFITNTVRKMW